MSRASSGETKEKILKAAESLFSEKGYDGSSMEEIARRAEINKPLIYYYFKSKESIKAEIFRKTINEGLELIGDTFDAIESKEGGECLEKELGNMIGFIDRYREIVKIMVMESLKDHDTHHSLMAYADILINHEIEGIKKRIHQQHPERKLDQQYLAIHEFFTGFIPIIMFVVLKEKWAAYFNCDSKRLMEGFIKAFQATHMSSHRSGFK